MTGVFSSFLDSYYCRTISNPIALPSSVDILWYIEALVLEEVDCFLIDPSTYGPVATLCDNNQNT